MDKKLVLAGGCFWGMQQLFRKQLGVTKTRVGYCGGDRENPTYDDVKTGRTEHAESIEISYDPSHTSLKTLLKYFFKIHDPTTENRQGNDLGSQYRSIIFYNDDEEEAQAQLLIEKMNASKKWPGQVVTELLPSQFFWDAETVHQDYLERVPSGYTCHFPRAEWALD